MIVNFAVAAVCSALLSCYCALREFIFDKDYFFSNKETLLTGIINFKFRSKNHNNIQHVQTVELKIYYCKSM